MAPEVLLLVEQGLGLQGVSDARLEEAQLAVETIDPLPTLVQLYSLAEQQQVRLTELTLRQPNLEDVFLQLTGRPLAGQEERHA